ncbi:oxidoreductase [Rubrivivax gelatinosus]|uniref:FAD-dependent 5-carboxymethylaminomethyl-2-thiouridine(34) oxidoreductase MnmC n=1 Tax=Rubrivivax gelatinosus TaxID=28068 RepID=UPI0019076F7B|nr:FAD-dependent 5-carboxymethylaminomethyl-2-thiouridine(34) oxidoreductase MnmC [Rubrivivax gelatinosus]MBK1613189.1 oxidoreductase [Rubrivivax gelatinosus]
MKTEPVVPANIAFDAAGQAHAPDFGDCYHPPIGAFEQAQHVFLGGNGLPGRWAGRGRFVVLETGFGLGNNFLATWAAWRDDPARCERLVFVSLERHPPRRADLEAAHRGSQRPELAAALLAAWPAAMPNLHPLAFDGGRVQLLLGFGDAAALLPELHLSADAIYLDGFAPVCNPAMWQPRLFQALGRLCRPGSTAATWSVARPVRDGLAAAGFDVQRVPGIGGKREISVARWAPRFVPPAPPRDAAAVPQARTAIVVGAGLAGAAVAQALAAQGLEVTVLERHARPAAETSGNPAGIFHGTVHADDGPHARLLRAGALLAARDYGALFEAGQVPGSARGLLRLDPGPVEAMRALAARQRLPADWVRPLDAAETAGLAGVDPGSPAWLYPGGGWCSPPKLAAHWLALPGVRFVGGVTVERVDRAGADWCVFDAAGTLLAQAPVLVLANASEAARLAAPWLPGGGWPLRRVRGQVSAWTGPRPPLQLPLAGGGYALPGPDGGVVFGATSQAGDEDTALRESDHADNLAKLARLTGLVPPADALAWPGRVGWRLVAEDKLPIIGALPAAVPEHRAEQPRRWPRHAGLFVCTALGSRGLTLAPLAGRLVAAMATSAPWPLEQDLADAVDPARWLARARRLGRG